MRNEKKGKILMEEVEACFEKLSRNLSIKIEYVHKTISWLSKFSHRDVKYERFFIRIINASNLTSKMGTASCSVQCVCHSDGLA
jgi:hypothetical protein